MNPLNWYYDEWCHNDSGRRPRNTWLREEHGWVRSPIYETLSIGVGTPLAMAVCVGVGYLIYLAVNAL